MIPFNDIQQLIDVYGKDIFANPRRVHAILSDWHPRQKVPFDEVQDTCRKYQKGEIKLPTSGNPAIGNPTGNPSIGNPSTGNPSAFANIIEKAKNLIISHSKASAKPVYRIIETAMDTDSTTAGNTTARNSNTTARNGSTTATAQNGSTTAAARNGNTATKKTTPAKPIKPTINTNPIDIKIDTSKSFRGGFR